MWCIKVSGGMGENKPMHAYQALEARFRRLNALREAAGMLNWDMSAMMPSGGAEARSEQLAALQVHLPRVGQRSGPCRVAGSSGGGRRAISTPGNAPTCARCAATGCTPRRCPRIWSRR